MPDNKAIRLKVDDREIEAKEGENLLHVCLENDIYIPNLCHIKGMKRPSASCRLCFVEIQGEDKPLPSCTLDVRDEMAVKTGTKSVRRLQHTALRLLLSAHHVDCGNCPANKRCELQNLAKLLKVGLKPGQLDKYLKKTEVDESHPCITYYPNRCVLCGKCVYVCKEKHGQPMMSFAKRGFDTVISFYGEQDSSTLPCEKCCACVEICPVDALSLADEFPSLDEDLCIGCGLCVSRCPTSAARIREKTDQSPAQNFRELHETILVEKKRLLPR